MKKQKPTAKWEPSKKRKKFADGRGWISITCSPHPETHHSWKPWSMAIYRKNGMSYLTVFAATRRELPGLMRLELAKKQNPAVAKVTEKMLPKKGWATGKDNNFVKQSYQAGKTAALQKQLNGLNPAFAIFDEDVWEKKK